MKYFLFFFSCIFSIKAYAQKVNSIKDPVINPALAVEDNPRLTPYTYFVNDNTVVFQERRNIRKVVRADTQSFSVSKHSDQSFMAKNKDGIFVNGHFVKTDTLGYQYMGFTNDGPFWRTQKAIYKNTTELKQLKASEFTPLKDSRGNYSASSGYYQFNNQVYYYSTLTPIDIHTVIFMERDQCYDKKGVYERGEKLLFEGEHLQYLSPYFYKVKNTLVKSGSFKESIPGSDGDSFMQLGAFYSKDKNHVYYENRIFSDADPSSFINISGYFSKDKNHVYEQTDIVKDADAATFVHLEGPYFKDKNHIYCRENILPIDISDADQVKIWNDRYVDTYITDGKKIFLYDSLLDESQLDIPSFGVVDKQMLCFDKNGVYEREYNSNTRKYSFKKIPFNYSTPPNKSNVFISDKMNEYIFYQNQAYNRNTGLFENLTQEQIDMTKTREKDLIKINGTVQFKSIYSMFLGQADNKIYWNNEETSADAGTFEKVKGTYSYYKDKNNVYLYSFGEGLTQIEGIDAGSVRQFNSFLADKDYIYTGNYRVIKSEKAELLAAYEGSWPMCGVGNPVSSTFYLFKNMEGYWLALISNKSVEVNKIKATDPSLKKFLGIK